MRASAPDDYFSVRLPPAARMPPRTIAAAAAKQSSARTSGRAMVLVTHKERAELYVEQFADRGLVASIEPA